MSLLELTNKRGSHGRELADIRCRNSWGGGDRYRGLQEGSTKIVVALLGRNLGGRRSCMGDDSIGFSVLWVREIYEEVLMISSSRIHVRSVVLKIWERR